MNLSIIPAETRHASALLKFELENRAYFEQWVHSRTDAYYHLAHVEQSLHKAELERQQDRSYQYLICEDQTILGRINLTSLVREHYNKASLGYRVGAAQAGRGVTSQAIALLCQAAEKEHKLWRLEAVVRPSNHASSRVLEKNGFQQYGHAKRCVYLNGEWHDLYHYERHLQVGG